MSKYKEVVAWFDNDRAGDKARAQVKRKAQLIGVKYLEIKTDMDPKRYSDRQILKRLSAVC